MSKNRNASNIFYFNRLSLIIKYFSFTIAYVLSLLLAVSVSQAQTITLSGTVKSESQVIEFATVSLKNVTDTAFQRSVQSDTLGAYQLEIPQKGRYLLSASVLGYKDYISDTIDINTSYQLDILLTAAPEQLQEVVVQSRKNTYGTDKGKLTFNVQNSALTGGQTALDLLKKLPGVSVGQNDQISLRGAAGINVMINGKMTYLSGNQLINYLKGMSAEDISKIELMATPPAEYDAAGNAGMINIVSKKNLAKGYAVDLRSVVSKGKTWMTNQNVSASLSTKKLNLYGSFDYNTPYTFLNSRSGNTINDNGNILHLNRKYDNDYRTHDYNWHIETDWQFLPKHKIWVSYHGHLDDWKGIKYSDVSRLNNAGDLQSYTHTQNTLIEPYPSDAVAMSYLYTIDSLGKKITADANYTHYRNFSDGLMIARNYAADGAYQDEDVLKISQPAFVKIISAKVDADLPFKKFAIKTGVKYAEVENDTKYRYDSMQAGNYIEIEPLSNHFKYKERIAAAYLSGSKTFNKTSVEAGLRMEYTHANGYTVKQGALNNWQYTKLFPSLAIEQLIDDNNKIDFSLSRRINRPPYTELNPVRWYNDPYFYFAGNPKLVPELAWAYALSYSLKNKYVFAAAYNQGINYIDQRLLIDDNGVSISSQSYNFGRRQRFDFTASAPFRLFPFWNVQFFSDLSHTSYPISMRSGEKRISLWAVTGSLQQDINFPKDFVINLAAYGYSSELRGIYIVKPMGYIDFGIKKSFFDKKMTAQLTLSDVFNSTRYRASSQSDIIDYYYNDKPYSRVIALSIKYHFGGELIKSASKKTEEQERL